MSNLILTRSHILHMLFVDLDTVPSFFHTCDQKINTRCPIIADGVFVWCFCSYKTDLKMVLATHQSYYSLLMQQRIEIDYTPAQRQDASSVALSLTVGEQHVTIPKDVPFTIISTEKAFGELAPRLTGRDDVLPLRPTSPHWPELLMRRLRAEGTLTPPSSFSSHAAVPPRLAPYPVAPPVVQHVAPRTARVVAASNPTAHPPSRKDVYQQKRAEEGAKREVIVIEEGDDKEDPPPSSAPKAKGAKMATSGLISF